MNNPDKELAETLYKEFDHQPSNGTNMQYMKLYLTPIINGCENVLAQWEYFEKMFGEWRLNKYINHHDERVAGRIRELRSAEKSS